MARINSSRSELLTAIRGLSAARDLPPEVILDALKAALISAYHKIPEAEAANVSVEISEATGEPHVFAHFAVVDEKYLQDPHTELTPEQAQSLKPNAAVGDVITQDVTPRDFGRIAAQTAKQVILQRIREAEREQTYSTYAEREGEIVYGTVQSVNRDHITVALDRVEAILPKSGQIPGERYAPNQRIRVYVSEVKRSPKGPQVVVSRTHREMLHKLMDLEIPEIFQGTVEIKAIAREAGSRSKVAVWSSQQGVDPVGACVGMRGVRIQALVRELGGEKIDVVEWNADPRLFIASALSPAKVLHVWLDEDGDRRTANVVVPDSQLSLAIGREGQNARLAAKLTGWRIDIRSETEASDVIEALRADERKRREEQQRARRAAEPPAEAVPAPEATGDALAAVAAPGPPEPREAAPVEVTPVPAAAAPEPAPAAPAVAADEVSAKPAKAKPDEWAADGTIVADEEEDTEEVGGEPGKKGKARRLVRDPKTGKLVAEHQRKRSRRRPVWEEEVGRWSEEELDDALGFTEYDFVSEGDAGLVSEGDAGTDEASDEQG